MTLLWVLVEQLICCVSHMCFVAAAVSGSTRTKLTPGSHVQPKLLSDSSLLLYGAAQHVKTDRHPGLLLKQAAYYGHPATGLSCSGFPGGQGSTSAASVQAGANHTLAPPKMSYRGVL